MPTDNLVVYVPKGMTFKGSVGPAFQPVQEDPRVQTFVTKNVHPGQAIEFTISGEGQMPREAQNSAMGQQAGGGIGDAGSEDTSNSGNRPGGGIGNPIGTPDPLTKYKWWILGVLALLLAAAAAFLLRKQGALTVGMPVPAKDEAIEGKSLPVATNATTSTVSHAAPPATGNAALLNSLKEELFAIESEKLSGTLSPAEYAEARAGLEAVLKRALKNR
jgi:hypothetical protein